MVAAIEKEEQEMETENGVNADFDFFSDIVFVRVYRVDNCHGDESGFGFYFFFVDATDCRYRDDSENVGLHASFWFHECSLFRSSELASMWVADVQTLHVMKKMEVQEFEEAEEVENWNQLLDANNSR